MKEQLAEAKASGKECRGHPGESRHLVHLQMLDADVPTALAASLMFLRYSYTRTAATRNSLAYILPNVTRGSDT